MKHHRPERTDPYVVHARREKTHIRHNHTLFGVQVTARRIIRDENGAQVSEEHTRTVALRDILRGAPYPTAFPSEVTRRAKAMRSRGASLDDTLVIGTGIFRPARETVVLGHYASYCTAGVPASRNDWRASAEDPTVYLPCVTESIDPRYFPRADRERRPGRNTAAQRARRAEFDADG
jgi:hypothetical protein